jgi:hypothetical protein
MLALLLLSLAVVAHVRAEDLFVDNVAGDDRFDGRIAAAGESASGPCRTIGKALRVANKGDRIVLAATGQPYRECLTLQAGRHSGLANEPFEIVGNGAILEGAAPVPPRAWDHVAGDLYRFSPLRKSYQLLFLAGKPAERIEAAPQATELPELKPLQWCLFERQVYFRTEKGRTPANYALSYTHHPVGITLYEVRNVVIRDLIIQGFQRDGVNAHDSVFGATLIGLTCRGNARSGVSIGGASQVQLDGCLLGNNGAAQLRTEGPSHTGIKNCDLLENTAPPIVNDGGEIRQVPATRGADATGSRPRVTQAQLWRTVR